jgi:hypothetical protein
MAGVLPTNVGRYAVSMMCDCIGNWQFEMQCLSKEMRHEDAFFVDALWDEIQSWQRVVDVLTASDGHNVEWLLQKVSRRGLVDAVKEQCDLAGARPWAGYCDLIWDRLESVYHSSPSRFGWWHEPFAQMQEAKRVLQMEEPGDDGGFSTDGKASADAKDSKAVPSKKWEGLTDADRPEFVGFHQTSEFPQKYRALVLSEYAKIKESGKYMLLGGPSSKPMKYEIDFIRNPDAQDHIKYVVPALEKLMSVELGWIIERVNRTDNEWPSHWMIQNPVAQGVVLAAAAAAAVGGDTASSQPEWEL